MFTTQLILGLRAVKGEAMIAEGGALAGEKVIAGLARAAAVGEPMATRLGRGEEWRSGGANGAWARGEEVIKGGEASGRGDAAGGGDGEARKDVGVGAVGEKA